VDRFLTSHNIYGFENQLKTGAVLVDLTAAYDTVNHKALLFKVAKVVKNATVVKILESLLNIRRFIYTDDLCIATQSNSFEIIENRLTDALTILSDYYKQWFLNANPGKT